MQKGERPEDAADAAVWLRELGAVDDEAMARRIVRRCADKGYGEARVRQELYAKGIPKQYWEDALEQLPDMADAHRSVSDAAASGRESGPAGA